MVTINAQERLVLQALIEEHGEYGKPVADVAIGQRVALKIETVRDVLLVLQEKELVSLVFTERGLVSFIEARGRLKLGELHAASSVTFPSIPQVTRIAVAGLTGTGKSLLVNKIVHDNLMSVVSIFPGTVELQRVQAEIGGRTVEFVDCPGLGSGRRFDKLYFEAYKNLVAESNVLLWTIRADTKVVSLDEDYFLELQEVASKSKARSLLALTYCDRIQPGTWLADLQRPDEEQARSLELRTIYLSGLLQMPLASILPCVSVFSCGIDAIRSRISQY